MRTLSLTVVLLILVGSLVPAASAQEMDKHPSRMTRAELRAQHRVFMETGNYSGSHMTAQELTRRGATENEVRRLLRSDIRTSQGTGTVLSGKSTAIVPYDPGHPNVKRAARAGRATRIGATATRAVGGPIGWSLLGIEGIWMGYRHFNAPPEWDFEGGDPDVGTAWGMVPEVDVREWPPNRSGAMQDIVATPDLAKLEYHLDPSSTGERIAVSVRCTNPEDLEDDIRTSTIEPDWRDGVTDTDRECDGDRVASELMLYPWTGGPVGEEWVDEHWDAFSSIPWHERQEADVPPGMYYWRTDLAKEAQSGGQARLVAEAECFDPVYEGTSTITNKTEWYDDHEDRPDIPSVSCLMDDELVVLNVYRELEDGSRRYLIGGPLEDGEEPIEDLVAGETHDNHFVARPMPSSDLGLDPSDEAKIDQWDESAPDLGNESSGDVVWWRVLWNVAEDREADPELDYGWQWDIERRADYECRFMGVEEDGTTHSHTVPMVECADYQWERNDEGESTTRDEVTDEQGTADDPDDADLQDGATWTGEPPGAHRPRGDCLGSRTETGSGMSSWLVFAGVACALEWAFVPQQTGEQVAQLRADLDTRVPFVAVPATQAVIDGVQEGWDEGSCSPLLSFWPYDNEGEVRSTPSYDEVGQLPCEPPLSQQWTDFYNMIAGAMLIGAVIAVFLLTSRALKGPG